MLGPILFSIYSSPIADIARRHNVKVHMYADDCQLYLSYDTATNIENTTSRLEACISDIRVWMRTNKLKLNDSKTEFMLLSPSNSKIAQPPLNISIGDENVGQSDTIRNLGMVWDTSLNMLPHINKLTQLSFIQLKNIRAIKDSLTYNALEKVIHSFITSRLDYGNACLFGLPDVALRRLQRIQNAAARVLSGAKKFDSITPILKRLHWLPVRQRITFKLLLITYKVINNSTPEYLKDLLIKKNGRALRDSNKLHVPLASTKTFGDRAFSVAAPRLWNNIPPDIRSIDNIIDFKQSIKTLLYSQCFDM